MSRIGGKNTKPEMIVRSLLHRMGYRFRLHDGKLPGCPDIVLKKYKTVIFVHGCFWHRHKGCKRGTIPTHRREWWLAKLNGTSWHFGCFRQKHNYDNLRNVKQDQFYSHC